jgi:hypothetical protein
VLCREERAVTSLTQASPELEHHIFPIVRYAETPLGGGPVAVAGTAFTFGEGTLITCWHCVNLPLGPGETYGVAVRRGGISSPYEFCSIDDLGRDQNGSDLALGRIDWTPGRGLSLAEQPADWGERVESFGYPFPLAIPDRTHPVYKALTVYSRFFRGYVTRLAVDEEIGRPVMELDMHCPPGLSGAPVIREDRREVVGVVFGDKITEASGRALILGRALYLSDVGAARSTATGGKALADFLL